jgi:hypothetical protein
MREELEQILSRYAFEFNTEDTRLEIKSVLNNYLTTKVDNSSIFDFKVEDRTHLIENNLYFHSNIGLEFLLTRQWRVYYQPTRTPNIMIMDITLVSGGIKVTNFEKNVIGDRNIQKLNLNL